MKEILKNEQNGFLINQQEVHHPVLVFAKPKTESEICGAHISTTQICSAKQVEAVRRGYS